MTWFDLAVAGAATAAVVAVPGAILALLLGMRGLSAWAAAFPFGVTVVSVAALAAPVIGMPWSIIPVAATTGVFAVVVAAVRALTLRGWRLAATDRVKRTGWILGTLVVVGIIVSAQLAIVIGSPANISQTFDNIFHLNAVRYALDNANASPLFVGSMTSTSGGMWFYPTAWHAIASLTVQLTGASIPVAANAMTVIFSALAWPAGALWLSVALFGRRPGVAVGAGLAIIGSASFPLLMVDYGVLYPLHLGIAVLPASLALAVRTLGIVRSAHWPTPLATVAVLGTLPGLAVAHPGALAAWIVLFTVGLVFTAVRLLRSISSVRGRVALVAALVMYAAAAFAVWTVLRPPAVARTWQPEMTVAQAIGEVALASPYRAPVALLVAALMIVGIVAAVRRRAVGGAYAVAALLALGVLYVAVAALPYPDLRDALTGSWYNNLPRVAAILPVAVIPLAGGGLDAILPRLSQWGARIATGESVRRFLLAGLAVVGILAALLPMRSPLDRAHDGYALTVDSPLVSSDEMALLNRLDDEVEPDAVIAGSPWTGAGLAYALSGRHVLQPHTLMDITPDMAEINDELDEAAPGAPVCAAVANTRVGYVLDFGDREVHGGDHPYPGFDRLASSSAVELVDRQGDARLYRVVGCAR